ncbi:4'-phosphopantetheinyl transferase family protein [Streptomyces noursei]|uniref:4'-phosphopantetheinyl transferase family protein n=1 Tax=Streptomyces noursei TaxID=1971 RepID=UPI00369A0E0C
MTATPVIGPGRAVGTADARGAVDVTDAGIARVRPGECHVWFAEASADLGLLSLLDATERDRYRQFLREQPRALYLTAHALARKVIAAQYGVRPAALRFAAVCKHCTGAHGKPRLVDPPFPLELSLSHSDERVAVALTLGADVGVDLERVGHHREDLPRTVLSAAERRTLQSVPEGARDAAFIRYWCRKEAVLKATGDGLLVNPAALTVSPPDAPAQLLAWDDRTGPARPVHLTDLDPGPGYRAAVAVLDHAPRVVAHRMDDVLGPPA